MSRRRRRDSSSSADDRIDPSDRGSDDRPGRNAGAGGEDAGSRRTGRADGSDGPDRDEGRRRGSGKAEPLTPAEVFADRVVGGIGVLIAAVAVLGPTVWLLGKSSAWPTMAEARARADFTPAKTPDPGTSSNAAAASEQVDVLHPPADGRVTATEVTVLWRSRVQRRADDVGKLYWRVKGAGGYRTVEARPGPFPSAAIGELAPGTEVEYFVTVEGRVPAVSPLRRFRVENGPQFALRVFRFVPKDGTSAPLPRSDDLRLPVEIRNPSDRTLRVKVTLRPPSADLAGDVAGVGSAGQPVVVGPHEVWTLRLLLHAARCTGGRYPIPMTLFVQDAPGGPWTAVDRAVAEVELPGPQEPQMFVAGGEPDPVTGAVEITVTNRGPAVPDLRIDADGDLLRVARMDPALDSIPLGTGESVKFRLRPVLTGGAGTAGAPMEGKLLFRSGVASGGGFRSGMSSQVTVRLPFPAGRRLFATDGPGYEVGRTLCRVPLGGGTTASIVVDGPDPSGSRIDLGESTPGAAEAWRLGVVDALTERPKDLPPVRPDVPEAALAVPPVPIFPVRAEPDPTRPRRNESVKGAPLPKPAPRPPPTAEEIEREQSIALSMDMMEAVDAVSRWTGVPALEHGSVKPWPAGRTAWSQPGEFTAVVQTRREGGRRVLWFANFAMGRVMRPAFRLSPPDEDADLAVLDMPEKGVLVAAWVDRSGAATGAGDRVRWRSSRDLGASWSAPADVLVTAPGRQVRKLVTASQPVPPGDQAGDVSSDTGAPRGPQPSGAPVSTLRLMVAAVVVGRTADRPAAARPGSPESGNAPAGKSVPAPMNAPAVMPGPGRGGSDRNERAVGELRVAWAEEGRIPPQVGAGTLAGAAVDAAIAVLAPRPVRTWVQGVGETGGGTTGPGTAGTGFEVVSEVAGADGRGELISRRWTVHGRPILADGADAGGAAGLGAGRMPVMLAEPAGVFARGVRKLWYHDGPPGAERILVRTRRGAGEWSGPVVGSAGYTGCSVPMAGMLAGSPGAVFRHAGLPGRLYWLGRDDVPVRLPDDRQRVDGAWLLLDFERRPVGESPAPADIDVRFNGGPVGRLPGVQGSGTWAVPIEPSLLKMGALGRHRVDVSADLEADPARSPVLAGVRLLVKGYRMPLVYAADQAEADAARLDPPLHTVFWSAWSPRTRPVPASTGGLRRILAPRSGIPGRAATPVEGDALLALPVKDWETALLRVPLSSSAWPQVEFVPPEAAGRYSVTVLTELGEPAELDKPAYGRAALVRVECVRGGTPAELRLTPGTP